MSHRSNIKADITDLDGLLKRVGAAVPELVHLGSPSTFDILVHPFTALILETTPEFSELLAIMSSSERVRKLSKMNAEEKIIDLGIISAAAETLTKEKIKKAKLAREAEEKKKGGEAG